MGQSSNVTETIQSEAFIFVSWVRWRESNPRHVLSSFFVNDYLVESNYLVYYSQGIKGWARLFESRLT